MNLILNLLGYGLEIDIRAEPNKILWRFDFYAHEGWDTLQKNFCNTPILIITLWDIRIRAEILIKGLN